MPTTGARRRSGALSSLAPYLAFAAFGAFWGGWGAALPALRAQAGVSNGQLGLALLFVSVGAIPAMSLTGRLLDRLGERLAAPLLAALGIAGVLVAVLGHGLGALIGSMVVLGAVSGAADVAVNTLAVRAEQQAARPLLARAHGIFSLAVVASSLGSGVLLTGGAGLRVTFGVVAVIIVVLAALVWCGTTFGSTVGTTVGSAPGAEGRVFAAPGPRGCDGGPVPPGTIPVIPLMAVGAIGAIAYAVENAHQSWGAVFLTEVFADSPRAAASAAATFAAASAATRLLLAPLSRSQPSLVLTGGALVATTGTSLLALATSTGMALVGLAIAAVGVSMLFPTLLSQTLRDTDPRFRGRATATISATAYVGYLVGPAFVGLLAQLIDLRAALVGVATLTVVFALAALPVTRWAAGRLSAPAGPGGRGRHPHNRPCHPHAVH